MFQAPQGAKAERSELKGRLVVLEFWATWCGPCIETIPHLNELADRFRDEPVQLLAITDEDPGVIRNFLGKNPIRAWVGFGDEATFEAYGVRERPLTVVVDKEGRVVALTTPNNLAPELIEGILARRPDALSRPIARVEIRPFLGTSGRRDYRPIDGGFEASNAMARGRLSIAWGVPMSRIDARTPLPERTFDVVSAVPGGDRAASRILLRGAIEASFGWRASVQTRDAEVLVLRELSDREPALPPAEAVDRLEPSPDRYLATQRTMKGFAADLEASLSRTVIDETGIDGSFRIELRGKRGDLGSMAAALRDGPGLELKPQTRTVKYLVVESADAAKP